MLLTHPQSCLVLPLLATCLGTHLDVAVAAGASNRGQGAPYAQLHQEPHSLQQEQTFQTRPGLSEASVASQSPDGLSA